MVVNLEVTIEKKDILITPEKPMIHKKKLIITCRQGINLIEEKNL